MDLRQLQNLVLLADELHFSRAARRAHLSQSAFTRSIQALEAETGMRLFDRSKRQVRITPAGERAATRARALIADARDLALELDFMRSGEVGNVQVCGGPFTARFLVMPVMAELHRQYPGVSARLEISDGMIGMEHLKDERIDLLVGDLRNLPPGPDVEVRPLGSFAAGFFCRAGHPLAERRHVAADDLRPFSLACVTVPPAFGEQVRKLLGLGRRAPLPIGFECSSVPALTDMTLATDMVLLAAEAPLREALNDGRLKRVALDLPGGPEALVSNFGIARLAGRTLSPAGERLYAMIVEAARELVAETGQVTTTYRAPARRP